MPGEPYATLQQCIGPLVEEWYEPPTKAKNRFRKIFNLITPSRVVILSVALIEKNCQIL